MPTPLEARAALVLLTGSAVSASQRLFQSTSGSPEGRRLALLDGIPALIDYYADGSAALAADFYEDEREQARIAKPFVPQLVVTDRVVKIRRAIAWAAEPLFDGGDTLTASRLAEVVQIESARPFRDTITGNTVADSESIGWKRVTAGGCAFCRMLASRGAVYREASARFAAHTDCHCTAAPVFRGGSTGPEASALQYVASRRSRSPEQKAALRDFLSEHYPN